MSESIAHFLIQQVQVQLTGPALWEGQIRFRLKLLPAACQRLCNLCSDKHTFKASMDHIKAYLVHSLYVPTNFHRLMQKLVIKVFQLSQGISHQGID